jgi:hypothetical protein
MVFSRVSVGVCIGRLVAKMNEQVGPNSPDTPRKGSIGDGECLTRKLERSVHPKPIFRYLLLPVDRLLVDASRH